jgi:cell shape-determining protein MreC
MILLSIYIYIRGYLLNSRFRFEVLEISWNELLNKLQKARDMNELIQAQRLFISRILEKLMLKEKFRSQYQRIRQLLDLTVRYHSFMVRN